jgi:hypothetical protein
MFRSNRKTRSSTGTIATGRTIGTDPAIAATIGKHFGTLAHRTFVLVPKYNTHLDFMSGVWGTTPTYVISDDMGNDLVVGPEIPWNGHTYLWDFEDGPALKTTAVGSNFSQGAHLRGEVYAGNAFTIKPTKGSGMYTMKYPQGQSSQGDKGTEPEEFYLGRLQDFFDSATNRNSAGGPAYDELSTWYTTPKPMIWALTCNALFGDSAVAMADGGRFGHPVRKLLTNREQHSIINVLNLEATVEDIKTVTIPAYWGTFRPLISDQQIDAHLAYQEAMKLSLGLDQLAIQDVDAVGMGGGNSHGQMDAMTGDDQLIPGAGGGAEGHVASVAEGAGAAREGTQAITASELMSLAMGLKTDIQGETAAAFKEVMRVVQKTANKKAMEKSKALRESMLKEVESATATSREEQQAMYKESQVGAGAGGGNGAQKAKGFVTPPGSPRAQGAGGVAEGGKRPAEQAPTPDRIQSQTQQKHNPVDAKSQAVTRVLYFANPLLDYAAVHHPGMPLRDSIAGEVLGRTKIPVRDRQCIQGAYSSR